MKRFVGKALAMAVMMGMFAGQAYAREGEIYTQNGDSSNDPYLNVQYDYGYDKEIIRTQILADEIRFIELRAEASANTYVSGYLNTKKLYLRDPNTEKTITINTDTGLTLTSDKSQGIHNLADGVALYDAVNKRQLDSAIAAVSSSAASNEALAKLDSKINQTDARMDRVGATAAALAGINYQPMAKGQSQVAVGLGGYKGKKATAIGMAYQFSDRVSGSVAGAANGSEHMFNVGFNYLFGQHSAKDVAQMAAAPGSMSLKEAELQTQVDSMKNEIAELKAMVKALAAK